VLAAIAARAALVVTDHFPTFIAPRQTRELRRLGEVPVVAVDSATVVPMGCTTAPGPRRPECATRSARRRRHYLHPVDDTAEARVRTGVDLASLAEGALLAPLDDAAAIARFVAGTAVDHAVPRRRSRAGPTRAAAGSSSGSGTGSSATRTNGTIPTPMHEPPLPLAPLRAPSRRTRSSSPRASRFRDTYAPHSRTECLTWRELAYNFAHFDPRTGRPPPSPPGRNASSPITSAMRAKHSTTATPLDARGKPGASSGTPASAPILATAGCHNYLRMLWGKSVIGWTPDAATALGFSSTSTTAGRWMGGTPARTRDPLVLREVRPPLLPRPVFGTVRYMSLRAAGKKFDVPRYIADQSHRLARRDQEANGTSIVIPSRATITSSKMARASARSSGASRE